MAGYTTPTLPKPNTGNLGYTPAYGSGFFQQNQYQNPYTDFINNNQALAGKFLNTANPLDKIKNPFTTAGGFAMDPFTMSSTFGWKTLDPNNPNIPAWMKNLQGGIRNTMDENASKVASSGVAAGRSGMGVAGGPDARSAMAMSNNKTLAQMYPQLYGQAVGYTNEGINQSNSAAGAYMNALSSAYGTQMGANADVYKSQLGTGAGLMNSVLQALQSGDAAQMQWAMAQLNAYQKDVDTYNTSAAANVKAQREGEARQKAANQELNAQNLLDQIFSPGNYTAGANSNPFLLPQIGRAQATGLMGTGKLGASKYGMTPTTGDIVGGGAGSGLSGYNPYLQQGGLAGLMANYA